MDYVLQYPITMDDVAFLNETTLAFEIFSPHDIEHKNDSGWCDMASGARIIDRDDRVAFLNVSKEDLLLLTLKYHDRLKPLHNGFKKIYKYNANIR